jgi:hypothetical protein
VVTEISIEIEAQTRDERSKFCALAERSCSSSTVSAFGELKRRTGIAWLAIAGSPGET